MRNILTIVGDIANELNEYGTELSIFEMVPLYFDSSSLNTPTLELLQSGACRIEPKEDDITCSVRESLSVAANGSNSANDIIVSLASWKTVA